MRDLKTHLIEYLGLKSPGEAESIVFVRGADLPAEYGEQYRFLGDERLADTFIAVVPDALWIKGRQPSESSAERRVILVRGGYYDGEGEKVRDAIAWVTHELAHCQRFLDRQEEYGKDSETRAFDDIGLDTYPNNKVEEHAFGRQFAYLKSKGIDKENIVELLKEHYGPEDFRFLDRVLDKIYGG